MADKIECAGRARRRSQLAWRRHSRGVGNERSHEPSGQQRRNPRLLRDASGTQVHLRGPIRYAVPERAHRARLQPNRSHQPADVTFLALPAGNYSLLFEAEVGSFDGAYLCYLINGPGTTDTALAVRGVGVVHQSLSITVQTLVGLPAGGTIRATCTGPYAPRGEQTLVAAYGSLPALRVGSIH